MGSHDGIRNAHAPLDSTDSKNGQPPVAGNIPQTICEITLTLTPKANDPVRRDTVQHIDG